VPSAFSETLGAANLVNLLHLGTRNEEDFARSITNFKSMKHPQSQTANGGTPGPRQGVFWVKSADEEDVHEAQRKLDDNRDLRQHGELRTMIMASAYDAEYDPKIFKSPMVKRREYSPPPRTQLSIVKTDEVPTIRDRDGGSCCDHCVSSLDELKRLNDLQAQQQLLLKDMLE
jgi:hypothetical protein